MPWTLIDIPLLALIACAAGVTGWAILLTRQVKALRAQLRAASGIDTLTGLRTRGAVHELAPRLVARALDDGRCAALLLIEIDPPTTSPVTAAGVDDLRRDVAVRLRGHLRPDALLARWSSDSFALCVAVDDERHARLIAERLRVAVAERPVVHRTLDGVWVQLPASITVGVAWAGVDEPLDGVLARADAALARARRQGRNRTAFSLSPAAGVAMSSMAG